MQNLRHMIGRLLIAITLIASPLSMTHASMNSDSPDVVQVTHMSAESVINHNNTKHDHKQHDDQSVSHNHDNSDCCSSICGGALAVGFYKTPCVPKRSMNYIACDANIAASEWVIPHRPPSI